MMHPAKLASNNANRYARYGLSLPQQTLRALEKRGIYCQPSVSIDLQHLARRYVLRGVESGGAVADTDGTTHRIGIGSAFRTHHAN